MNSVYRRSILLFVVASAVIALPFIFRQEQTVMRWQTGDPLLIIISPHNEAIRTEFAVAFEAWHAQHYGRPARIDWRNMGGTSEIMRYLESEMANAYKAWRTANGGSWPPNADALTMDRRFNPSPPPADSPGFARWQQQHDLVVGFRNLDDASAFGSGIDLFFGGGAYDHGIAAAKGITVAPWDIESPPEEIRDTNGREHFPTRAGGEIWRTATFFGTALSTFGICYNADRLNDLQIESPPTTWHDLADPRYFGQIGVADPTKSGSIAKAFELIIHTECRHAVERAGFLGDADRFEQLIREAGLPDGKMPPDVPTAYQQAIETGWENGIRLIQKICANARYFTDGAGKVPIDVSNGDAAAGLAIDFFGRYQAGTTRDQNGQPRMHYVTPTGGSGVSADPISLLRGAPHRELAIRFMRFTLGTAGQRLWTYRVGTPGGPVRYALRRLPIRRDFYPAPDHPAIQAIHEEHLMHSSDPLDDPGVNPYALASHFTYYPRWTARHFNIHRDLIRAMGLDSSVELKAAWRAIQAHPDRSRRASAIRLLERLPSKPERLNWQTALRIGHRHSRMDLMREWTLFYRDSYREAQQSLLEE